MYNHFYFFRIRISSITFELIFKNVEKLFIIENSKIFNSIWWVIAFVLLMLLCMNSIYNVWWKWRDTPVIISQRHNPMSIGDVPFPAATICPETKTLTKIFNYTDVYRSMLKLDGINSRIINGDE